MRNVPTHCVLCRFKGLTDSTIHISLSVHATLSLSLSLSCHTHLFALNKAYLGKLGLGRWHADIAKTQRQKQSKARQTQRKPFEEIHLKNVCFPLLSTSIANCAYATGQTHLVAVSAPQGAPSARTLACSRRSCVHLQQSRGRRHSMHGHWH